MEVLYKLKKAKYDELIDKKDAVIREMTRAHEKEEEMIVEELDRALLYRMNTVRVCVCVCVFSLLICFFTDRPKRCRPNEVLQARGGLPADRGPVQHALPTQTIGTRDQRRSGSARTKQHQITLHKDSPTPQHPPLL